mmetsp:Transcript_121085/g.314460  ORF Transcript_121085/g.314460 Transcript_121085/m.314460 type:complete len:109 (-) Transcript_121085:7-333(-)
MNSPAHLSDDCAGFQGRPKETRSAMKLWPLVVAMPALPTSLGLGLLVELASSRASMSYFIIALSDRHAFASMHTLGRICSELLFNIVTELCGHVLFGSEIACRCHMLT